MRTITNECDKCGQTITNTDSAGRRDPMQGGISRAKLVIGKSEIHADLCTQCEKECDELVDRFTGLMTQLTRGMLDSLEITWKAKANEETT